MALEDASRGARTVISVEVESTYGTDPGGTPSVVPVYNARTPIQASVGVLELDRAKDSLGLDSIASGLAFYDHEFSTYLFGNGTSTLEGFTTFFKGCGLGAASDGGPVSITGAGPSAPTLAEGSAGNLTGTYYYKMVHVTTATGAMTFGGTASASVTVSAKKIDVSFSAPGSGKTGLLFRTKAGGSTYYFLTTIATAATSYSDDVPDSYLDYSWQPASYTSANTETQYVWTPISDTFKSLYFRYYLNGERRIASGSRGSFSYRLPYGEQAEVRWNLRGMYNAASATSNVSGACDPGMPPKGESCSVYLIPQSTGTAITPFRVKSVGYDHGAVPTVRGDLNSANSGVAGIDIVTNFNSRVTMTIEKAADGSYDPVAAMVAGTRYAAGWVVGSGLYGRWAWDFPRVMLNSAPREVLVEDDVRAWELEFRPVDGWDVYASGYSSAATCLANRWVRVTRR